MKQENYWEQFVSTGKVEDYLKFCNSFSTDLIEEKQREGLDAGTYKYNGNDIKDNAYR